MSQIPVGKIIGGLLKVVGIGSVLAVSIAAPNAIQILTLFEPKKRKNFDYVRDTKNAVQEMRKQKLIEFHDDPRRGKLVRLTPKGLRRLNRVRLQDINISRPDNWDKQWRMVIFDIPRGRQHERLTMLSHIRRMGFYQLKQSVWVFPFPCEDEINKLFTELELNEYSIVSTGTFRREVDIALRKRFRSLINK